MRRSVRVILNGQQWTIKRVKRIRNEGEDCFGLCDYAKRTIYLEESLTGPKLLRFTLHGCQHGRMELMSEEAVDQFSGELAVGGPRLGLLAAAGCGWEELEILMSQLCAPC